MASLHLDPQVNGFNKEHKLLPGSSSSYSSSWLYLQTSLPQWKHQNHPFKIRSSVFNSLQNQTQRNISNLQEDITLGDPLCGFSVLQEQTAELEEEAKNVFREVLEGLARLFVQYCCWEKCIRNPWIWALKMWRLHPWQGWMTHIQWMIWHEEKRHSMCWLLICLGKWRKKMSWRWHHQSLQHLRGKWGFTERNQVHNNGGVDNPPKP